MTDNMIRINIDPELAHYLRHIHNPAKRRYAHSYAYAALHGLDTPDAPADLSYMAAQAVRISIDTLLQD